MNSAMVRSSMIDALRLDLIGPGETLGDPARMLGDPREILPQRPSTWYLTGFLVPLDAKPEQRCDAEAQDEIDEAGGAQGLDDEAIPEPATAKARYFPSSMGASLLISAEIRTLKVIVRWGDYTPLGAKEGDDGRWNWERKPKEETIDVNLPESNGQPHEFPVPQSGGLKVVLSSRTVPLEGFEDALPQGTRSISVFLVNQRTPKPDAVRDQAFIFQAQLEIHGDRPFTARPNLKSIKSSDPDERIADLQYRDAFTFAVGHSIATEAAVNENRECWTVRTCWIPQAEVERVAPCEIESVELSMDALSQLTGGDDAQAKLNPFAVQYRNWIEEQKQILPSLSPKRREVANELLHRANKAAERIGQGIERLSDPIMLEAFRISNRVMAAAARQRMGVMQGKDPASVQPAWRPFQLAFILMNLPGIADPLHEDREVVDLLFFPTGGGKTEAYLGLAAFTLVLRRLQNPSIASAGLSVLMRYTLRLLTLDQLSRASTLICALELERKKDVEKLGTWPFEIGLWVGKAATPNVMGSRGDNNSETARARTIAYKNDDSKPSPIPLENCPWCGKKFNRNSFSLVPNSEEPLDLRITCINPNCSFTRDNRLPILAVDEPIYRRLPCFMIATVDKFAAMPWTGNVGQFFGRVNRYDRNGFYGPCEMGTGQAIPGGSLLPPDLIIQDELHLISGPLGTIVGLYETALEKLCCRESESKTIRPKIVASTATVRRAEKQIRALFNRRMVDIFPPPGPDRRHSFFAETHTPQQSNARMYIGVAAQGRSPKVVMMRVYLALLAAAQKEYQSQGKKKPDNPADPYMTLLGYFNSLRELGGSRRLVEDEVNNRVSGYGSRKRVNEATGLFVDRKIAYEVVELTSRVSTNKVADAKRRLALSFTEKERVDVALATNMISVGLDIIRLGLMVVFGQPKTSAEYIQATSRVGRDHARPGLIVTILNINKPRDRSHYEQFTAYHQSFYRAVEVTSVTPFSPRALDRGLAGTLVGLARLGHAPMTPPKGASEILHHRAALDFVVDALTDRAENHADLQPADATALRLRVRDRCVDLFDEWSGIAHNYQQNGVQLQYQTEVGAANRLLYEFLNPELKIVNKCFRKFRANRSMRDVEPTINIWLKTSDGIDIEGEDDQR